MDKKPHPPSPHTHSWEADSQRSEITDLMLFPRLTSDTMTGCTFPLKVH